jgi:hypothetical protein
MSQIVRTRSTLIVATATLAVLLAGCAPGTTTPPTGDPEPEPTETVVTEPVASAVIVSLDGLTVVDETGGTMQAVRFDDPPPLLFLLDELLGSTPEPVVSEMTGASVYVWGELQYGVADGGEFSWLRADVADIAGLPLETSQGIHLGSTCDEVEALDPFIAGDDFDGDGQDDVYGLESAPVPGTESLTYPGETGTAFIAVGCEAGAVTWLHSPSSDFGDV